MVRYNVLPAPSVTGVLQYAVRCSSNVATTVVLDSISARYGLAVIRLPFTVQYAKSYPFSGVAVKVTSVPDATSVTSVPSAVAVAVPHEPLFTLSNIVLTFDSFFQK